MESLNVADFTIERSLYCLLQDEVKDKNICELLSHKQEGAQDLLLEIEQEDAPPLNRRGSYREQGDLKMYTDDNITRRKALQSSRAIENEMAKYWQIFELESTESKPPINSITKNQMIAMELRVCKALFSSDEWDVNDAREAAKCDWERQEGTALIMSELEFFHSLFEIVDMWTTSISEEGYVTFLKRLFQR